ncbi:kinesin-like protein KIN-14J, partial [Tanacetum coccineum]
MGENRNAMAIECLADDELLSQAHPEKRMFQIQLVANTNNLLAEEVYADTRPLIQSVVDGFDVCICIWPNRFGKSHTMTGPRVSEVSEEEWGVNHRALNDLFQLCEDRRHSFKYEIQ